MIVSAFYIRVLLMNIIEKDIWQQLSGSDSFVVIYGTGNGADKILDEFERRGISVSAVTASDDHVRGQTFRGFSVRSIGDAAKEFSDMILVISFGSQRSEVISHILSLSEKYTVLCADVPVYGNNIFDRSFFEAHISGFEKLYSVLADEHSKKVLENIINFKLSGKLNYLTESFSQKQEAFELLSLGENESYLDLGAYRGDTIEEFLYFTEGQYKSITALEPDRKTYLKLKAYAGNFRNVQLFNMGIWSEDMDLFFESSLGRGSSIKEGGAQTLAVTKIDTLFKRRKVTYIKADVEGAEEQMLLGGKIVIARDKPKLNIALYHRSEDIFKLPLMIHDINPDYKLYIRQHPHIPAWDLNLYAI